jgi:type III secretion system YscQ/HrcQ family protein
MISDINTNRGAGTRPLALRKVAAAQVAALLPLQDRHFVLDIGMETWRLRFSPQPGPLAGPNLYARGEWLGHQIGIQFPHALLQRTLQISAPGLPAMTIPDAMFATVASNAVGAWLTGLPYQDSLRIDGVDNIDDIDSTEDEKSSTAPDPEAVSPGYIRMHLLAQRVAPAPLTDAINYTISLDMDPALIAALPQLCAGLPAHPPGPRTALLELPLKLTCEIGRIRVAYATLDALRHGDILFFTPYADQHSDTPAALTIQLSYRMQTLMQVHILQPGLMVITDLDMNNKKSFLYDDLVDESTLDSDPFHAIDPLLSMDEEDGGESGCGAFADAPSPFSAPANFPHNRLDQLPLQVVFDVGHCEMSFADLQKLQAGSVIPLASRLPEVVKVTVNGRVIASGELVEIDGKIGVMLARLADVR